MNKLSLNFIVLIFASALFCQGQTVQSEDEFTILPEKGDFSIGTNLVPILKIINGTGDIGDIIPTVDFKIMLEDKKALRMEFMFNHLSLDQVDLQKATTSSYGFGIGPEFRGGTSRVQGFYGLMFSALRTNVKAIDTSTDNEVTAKLSTFGIGAHFFLGAECFIAPKFAIGTQVSWGPSHTWTSNLDDDKIKTFDMSANNLYGALMLTYYF